MRGGEIHRLASKTRRAMGADGDAPAACHSERSDAEKARTLQAVALDPVTLEPLLDPPAH